MNFLKRWLGNIILIVAMGIVLLILFPKLIGQSYSFLYQILGPLVILIIIVYALPNRRRKN
jgi:cytochrome bd-type quinol oxidase subunit 2